MRHQTSTISQPPVEREDLGTIRDHIVQAAIGKTVDLRTGPNSVIHGIVSGVFNEAGRLKIVVRGIKYDQKQILTIAPTSIY
jgi:hypothetical protein